MPLWIEVSPDRRTLTVVTNFSASVQCGSRPGGLYVDVKNGVAVITAMAKRFTIDGGCDAVCGTVTQTITLDEPLPEGVRFEPAFDADPGCGSVGG